MPMTAVPGATPWAGGAISGMRPGCPPAARPCLIRISRQTVFPPGSPGRWTFPSGCWPMARQRFLLPSGSVHSGPAGTWCPIFQIPRSCLQPGTSSRETPGPSPHRSFRPETPGFPFWWKPQRPVKIPGTNPSKRIIRSSRPIWKNLSGSWRQISPPAVKRPMKKPMPCRPGSAGRTAIPSMRQFSQRIWIL